MSVYLIVDITIHDPDRYREYVRQVPAFIEKHHGKYLIRGGEIEVREGDWHPQRLIVLEFSSREQARAFLDDPEYQTVAAIRHASTTSNAIVVEGYEST